MRLVRLWSVVSLVVLSAFRVEAQVSCANPDNLCTGDPCTITTVAVQSPCVVDFGARDLVIAGTIDVPDGGTLDFTAETILQQGPIDGRHVGNGVGNGASITLESTVGDIESRGEIDVTGTATSGSITVTAAGNLLVKDNLNAKTSGANVTAAGGGIALTAGGTIDTDQTAVLDAQGTDTTAGGSVTLNGGGNVTVKGRVRTEGNPGGSIGLGSSGGAVTVEKDLRVESPGTAGTVVILGFNGVTLEDDVRAEGHGADGGDVTLMSANGNVTIRERVRIAGDALGGSLSVTAPNGTVTTLKKIDARSGSVGGTIDIAAATVAPTEDIDARGKVGSGGSVELSATSAVTLDRADIDVSGKTSAGTIDLLGDAASGNITVGFSKLRLKGTSGAGGVLTVSAPAGTVTMNGASIELTAKNGLGGSAQIDGVGITTDFKTRFLARDGGEVRFDQSGAGLLSLIATFDVRVGGVVEALAPAGDLTAVGKAFTDGGCVGMSAGGTLNTASLSADVPITPSCP